MMNIMIMCVEDERTVLDALVRDLRPFSRNFQIEAAESVDEARRVIEVWTQAGKQVGLVLADHLMPGTTGVEFLVELCNNPRTAATRKVLVTAHAGLKDTIQAINDARLNHYIAKPWCIAELNDVVKEQLTDFVIENAKDPLTYAQVLDGKRILESRRDITHTRAD